MCACSAPLEGCGSRAAPRQVNDIHNKLTWHSRYAYQTTLVLVPQKQSADDAQAQPHLFFTNGSQAATCHVHYVPTLLYCTLPAYSRAPAAHSTPQLVCPFQPQQPNRPPVICHAGQTSTCCNPPPATTRPQVTPRLPKPQSTASHPNATRRSSNLAAKAFGRCRSKRFRRRRRFDPTQRHRRLKAFSA